MQPIERVKRAIHFEQPDRLPIQYCLSSEFIRKHVDELNKFLKDYPSDFGPIDLKILEKEEKYPRKYEDEWGCVWLDLLPGMIGEVKEPALKDWHQLKDFRVPPLPYENEENFKKLKRNVERSHSQGYYVAIWGCFRGGFNLFERMQWLRGVENFFIDLITNRNKVEELADIITEEYSLKGAKYLIKAGVDGFYLPMV